MPQEKIIVGTDQNLAVKVGDELIYAFQFSKDQIEVGPKPIIQHLLAARLSELRESPFLLIDVLKFTKKWDELPESVRDAADKLASEGPEIASQWARSIAFPKKQAGKIRRAPFEDSLIVRIDWRFASAFKGTETKVALQTNANRVQICRTTETGEVLLVTHNLKYDSEGRLAESRSSSRGLWSKLSVHIDPSTRPRPLCLVRYSGFLSAALLVPIPAMTAALVIVLLFAVIFHQTAIVNTQRAELARITADADASRSQIAELEKEISRLEQPPIPETHPLVARLDLSLPSGSLGTGEPVLEKHFLPAQFRALELTFHHLPESISGTVVEATVEGGSKPIQGRRLVVTKNGTKTSAILRLTSEELGTFADGRRTIIVSLSEPGHALLGRIGLLLEKD